MDTSLMYHGSPFRANKAFHAPYLPFWQTDLPYTSEIRAKQRPITEGTSNVTFVEIGRVCPTDLCPTRPLWVLHTFGCAA